MILDEHLPRAHRLAVPIALARTTIDDRGTLLALAIRVDAGIEGILQNRDNVTVPDWPPFERCQRAAVRRVGKVNVLRRHPQQYLAGAAEFAELLKDEPDHLLQPPIWIETKADEQEPPRHRSQHRSALRRRHGPKPRVVENEFELAWCRQGCLPASKLRASCER